MKLRVIITLFIIYLFNTTCSNKISSNEASIPLDLVIDLRWIPSYENETQDSIEIGLKWIMSYLGAMLPQEFIKQTMVWSDENIMTLDISKAGFSSRAERTWARLLKHYKNSQEYKTYKSMDIGQFVLLSFNASWHYYAITAASPNLTSFQSQYEFDSDSKLVFLPGRSGVTSGLRIVHSSKASSVNRIAHTAEEGIGENINDFKKQETEVFDIMPNGQPRFAVYGLDGNLKVGGNPLLSRAGKPAKCMWCHESGVQLPFRVINKYPLELANYKKFNQLVNTQNDMLDNYYNNFLPRLDTFRNQKNLHYLAELLYITYQTPTTMRAEGELALLNIDNDTLHLPIHMSYHHEFKFLKNIVSRKTLDSITNLHTFPTLTSRETTVNEINLLVN